MTDHKFLKWQELAAQISGNTWKHLSRGISMIENEIPGYKQFLSSLPQNDHTRIIGITGPPGAGKSTLTDHLIGEMVAQNKKVAVLCIDPSSPFNRGALLGDRIRMNEWYNEPLVFIRSLSTRGSLGGLHPKIIEITEMLKAAGFDYIIIETVGVGQSEISIAALADITVVVLVPEAGDDIQVMKAGLMEIADIFVVNKCDRPGADIFANNLIAGRRQSSIHQLPAIPVLKTVAHQKKGIHELYEALLSLSQHLEGSSKKFVLLAERAYQLIQEKRMKDVDKARLAEEIAMRWQQQQFNLYQLVEQY